MWQANLDAINIRTDGGVDLLITYFDDKRKYQKTHTVFGDFDLSAIASAEVNRSTFLYIKFDSIKLGPITISSVVSQVTP